jgi:hypothetical protein
VRASFYSTRARFGREGLDAKLGNLFVTVGVPTKKVRTSFCSTKARCGREGIDATLDNLFWTCEVQKKVHAPFYSRRRGAVGKASMPNWAIYW